jgi:hypothetical protein
MEKIGHGLQYDVYSKGDKVIKVPTKRIQIAARLFSRNPSIVFDPFRLCKETGDAVRERKESVENLRKNCNLDLRLLGNPVFRDGIIEQDRVKILDDYLKQDHIKAKEWVDRYIEFIFESWRNGFSEKVYNLTVNNGVDKSGKLILVDFGELTFKKIDVAEAIRIKRWEQSWSFSCDLGTEIKEYYQKEMEKNLTLDNLDKYWKDCF